MSKLERILCAGSTELPDCHYPPTTDAAPEAIFTFAHEVVGRLVDEAIRDNTTPAEQRTGTTGGYQGNGAVRGGALLLQRVAPELAPGYMRFYHDYWTHEQQARGAAFAQVNQLWVGQYYQKLARFLNNTQQGAGEMILSLPIGGEGRTISDGKQSNAIAVDYPTTTDAAPEAIYTFAHEVVARLVDEAIRDNTTPAEQRAGTTGGYQGNGAVRGGALLLQRVAPELAPGYMRFYLRTAGADRKSVV